MAVTTTTMLKYLFAIEKKKHQGLMLVEWGMMIYAAITLVLMLVFYTRLQNPLSMLALRIQSVLMVLALWWIYRMIPCRFIMLLRVICQIVLLATWYPDTYEFNRLLPNLDHHFAGYEQALFGCQPALLFSRNFASAWVSEPLTLGYVSYYPMMVFISFYYFFYKYEQFLKAAFVIVISFFVLYLVFIFLPVAGPQYYYLAAGTDQIAQGIFPNIGHYFETHSECLPIPGYHDGVFYKILAFAHNAGERPTAAFPSSHMGVTTVMVLLAHDSKNRKMFWTMLVLTVLMFFATFYIQAHYVIDAIAGVFSGIILYFLTSAVYKLFPKIP